MIYSFDIFDTLITRKVVEPIGVFVVMQNKIEKEACFAVLPPYCRTHFCEIRVNAESEARLVATSCGREEVRLEDIYEMLQLLTGISESDKKQLMRLELELELELSVPLPHNIAILKNRLKDGKVYLISDMYLPADFVRKLLLKADCVFADIPLLISGEIGKTKRTGSLYQYFVQEYKVEKAKWIHMGDNPLSDGRVVGDIGGQAELCKNIGVDSYEESIVKKHRYTVGFQAMYGEFRRNNEWKGSGAVGYQVGGPVLYAYVLWVLQEAQREGISTLYFIARDGYILRKIADIIIRKQKLSIKTKYLYGSRKAWRVPAVCEDRETLRKWFVEKCYFSSLKQLADSLHTEVEKIQDLIPKHIKIDPDNIAFHESNIVRELLLYSGVLDDFLQYGRDLLPAVKGYLQQEMEGAEEKIGFVELNGTGYTQVCLKQLLNGIYEGEMVNFYYTLQGMSVPNDGMCRFIRYSYQKLPCPDIVEIMARAPHGQTVGYCYGKNGWEPVLDQDTKEYLEGETYNAYCDGVLSFAKSMSEYVQLTSADFEGLARDILKRVCEEPADEVGTYLGDMPFSSYGNKGDNRRYAPELSKKELRQLFLYTKGSYLKKYTGNNLEFSKARAMSKHRKRIEFYKRWQKKMPAFLCCSIKTQKEKSVLVEGRVILYGAGKIGKALYEEYRSNRKSKVELWVDLQYAKYAEEGYPVESPDNITRHEYDYVVIGVVSAAVRLAIREKLVEMGIPNEKIV